jgi:1,2-diacylglycerol 3-alpha-glucosyltransferase
LKVALLCSGLGNIYRGHEIFARDLFAMLKDDIDITLFKGGGAASDRERVIANIPRDAAELQAVTLPVSPRWMSAAVEQERLRIETETFAYAALHPLLQGQYDVIHCLEREVCERLYGLRHLFAKTPKILFSNGGAIPAAKLPSCDFVQEHTPHNLQRSAPDKSFLITHGVDLDLFKPGITSDFRARHGIPAEAFVAISVGTVCYWHKRMDHVIRELAGVPDVHLLIVGQDSPDTPAIKALGHRLMPGRITFTRMPHDELPQAYAAADVFVLGSLFETFGIVYIEAMAMGLPVISTQHPNQRAIIRQGIFVDMAAEGALAAAIRDTPRERLRELGRLGPDIARRHYDLRALKASYISRYHAIAASPTRLPHYDLKTKLSANLGNAFKHLARILN